MSKNGTIKQRNTKTEHENVSSRHDRLNNLSGRNNKTGTRSSILDNDKPNNKTRKIVTRTKDDNKIQNKVFDFNGNPVTNDNNGDNVADKGNQKMRYFRVPSRTINDIAQRKAATLMIFTLLKAGVKENSKIQSYVEAHGLLEVGDRQFSQYIQEARKLIIDDHSNTSWLTAKIQSGFTADYKRSIELLDERIESNCNNKKYFDDWIQELFTSKVKTTMILGVMNIINQIDTALTSLIKEKLDILEGGPMNFRIKRYIDFLHTVIEGNGISIEKQEIYETSRAVDKISGNVDPDSNKKLVESKHVVLESKEFKIAPHLKAIEDKLGKKLNTLEEERS